MKSAYQKIKQYCVLAGRPFSNATAADLCGVQYDTACKHLKQLLSEKVIVEVERIPGSGTQKLYVLNELKVSGSKCKVSGKTAENIFELIESDANLTQADIARELGISRQAVSSALKDTKYEYVKTHKSPIMAALLDNISKVANQKMTKDEFKSQAIVIYDKAFGRTNANKKDN
jgi:predicted ArsR family transcriptional regulator